jgi:hypothetical protein
MQQAQFQLDDLFERASKFTDAEVPNRQRMLAEAARTTATPTSFSARRMCEMALDGGPKMTKQEVWASPRRGSRKRSRSATR